LHNSTQIFLTSSASVILASRMRSLRNSLLKSTSRFTRKSGQLFATTYGRISRLARRNCASLTCPMRNSTSCTTPLTPTLRTSESRSTPRLWTIQTFHRRMHANSCRRRTSHALLSAHSQRISLRKQLALAGPTSSSRRPKSTAN